MCVFFQCFRKTKITGHRATLNASLCANTRWEVTLLCICLSLCPVVIAWMCARAINNKKTTNGLIIISALAAGDRAYLQLNCSGWRVPVAGLCCCLLVCGFSFARIHILVIKQTKIVDYSLMTSGIINKCVSVICLSPTVAPSPGGLSDKRPATAPQTHTHPHTRHTHTHDTPLETKSSTIKQQQKHHPHQSSFCRRQHGEATVENLRQQGDAHSDARSGRSWQNE